MLRNTLLLGTVALLGTGCAMSGNDGIWMFFVGVQSDPECTETVDHNYTGATAIADDTTSDWTYDESIDASEGIFFGQIFSSAGGEEKKLLVTNDAVYTGTKVDGMWVFEWMNTESTTESDTHTSGYSFLATNDLTDHTILELDLSGNAATGTITHHATHTQRWEESDTWDRDAVGGSPSGRTPSQQHLEDVDGNPVRNVFDTTNCSSSPCYLEVSETCMGSGDVEAHQTEYDKDAYDAVDEAGQPIGLGGTN